MRISMENIVTGENIKFGTSIFPYALSEIDLGQVPAQHNTVRYINLNGSHLNNTSLNERDVSISGWVFAQNVSEMKEYKAFLNHFFNPRHEINIYYSDYVLTIRPDASIKYSTDKNNNTALYCQWMMQGTAHYPLWKLKTSEVRREAKAIGTPLFPLVIPEKKGIAFGYIPAESIGNVVNDGDVEVGFIMRLKAEEGPVTNPRITDNKTQKFIEVISTMDIGDIIEISTITGNKYVKFLRGQNELDIINSMSKRSSPDMALSVGMNDLTITAAENAVNMTAVLIFHPAWLEVQGEMIPPTHELQETRYQLIDADGFKLVDAKSKNIMTRG